MLHRIKFLTSLQRWQFVKYLRANWAPGEKNNSVGPLKYNDWGEKVAPFKYMLQQTATDLQYFRLNNPMKIKPVVKHLATNDPGSTVVTV